MGRRRKTPTKLVRIADVVEAKMRREAKRKKMSLPDYLNWRLQR